MVTGSVSATDPGREVGEFTRNDAMPPRSAAHRPAGIGSPIPRIRGTESLDLLTPRECVYIIDDDPSVRSSLANLVAAAGLSTRSHESVDDFLDHGADAVAGCFLLDVRLPGLNGLDFLTRMEALGLHLPVILISGHGDVPMTVRGMRAGAIDFLTKPFHPGDVLEAVSRALELDRDRRRERANHSGAVARYNSLTPRERQVMALVTAGKMNKQAAGVLGLSEITVKVYRAAVMRKMGVRTLADLVKASEQLVAQAPGLQPVPES